MIESKPPAWKFPIVAALFIGILSTPALAFVGTIRLLSEAPALIRIPAAILVGVTVTSIVMWYLHDR